MLVSYAWFRRFLIQPWTNKTTCVSSSGNKNVLLVSWLPACKILSHRDKQIRLLAKESLLGVLEGSDLPVLADEDRRQRIQCVIHFFSLARYTMAAPIVAEAHVISREIIPFKKVLYYVSVSEHQPLLMSSSNFCASRTFPLNSSACTYRQ